MLWKSTSILFIVTSTPSTAETLAESRQNFVKRISEVHSLSDEESSKLEKLLKASDVMSQGNPAVTSHPFTTAQCLEKLNKKKIKYENPVFTKICGTKYMAPLYDPTSQKPKDAKVCIDQFEFPSIPCEYPLVWTRADEAHRVCQAVGKRMCDAHEWEGACEGRLTPPDYPFAKVAKLSEANAVRQMRKLHNQKHASKKTWSYGKTRKKGICAMNSTKDAKCNGGNWKTCGSNTYPMGMFPECGSKLKVYDIHGNAAEHMNLPVRPDQMASKGSATLGHTEMKGSWFIFDKYKAHQDWCRWRAPYWHGSKVMYAKSHHNYHLGFRCCKDIGAAQVESWGEKKQ